MKLKDWLMLKLCSRAEDIHTIVEETRTIVKELTMKMADLRLILAAFVAQTSKVFAEVQAGIDDAKAKQAELQAKIDELIAKGDEVPQDLQDLVAQLGTGLQTVDDAHVDPVPPVDPSNGNPIDLGTSTDSTGTDTLTDDRRV